MAETKTVLGASPDGMAASAARAVDGPVDGASIGCSHARNTERRALATAATAGSSCRGIYIFTDVGEGTS